jgi:hypothetical protein
MDNNNHISQDSTRVYPEEYLSPGNDQDQKKIMVGIIIGGVLVILLTVAFVVFLMVAPAATTARIRDIFIIFLALQSLLIGVVLILLIIQVAKLTNLLQNEIKPILNSTNETVSNLRGTAEFLSNNMVEPVMKANEYSASMRQFFAAIGLLRRTGSKSKGNDN